MPQEVIKIELPKSFWKGIESKMTSTNERIWERLWGAEAKRSYQTGTIQAALQTGTLPTTNIYAREYFERHGLEFVKTLTETDIVKFKELMSNPDNWGIGGYDFAAKLDGSWLESDARAALIYDQEMANAYRMGMQDFIDNEYMFNKDPNVELWKTWHHGAPAVPRPNHVAVDGEEVRYEDDFSNGLQYPGSDGDVVGCTCWLTYQEKPTVKG